MYLSITEYIEYFKMDISIMFITTQTERRICEKYQYTPSFE